MNNQQVNERILPILDTERTDSPFSCFPVLTACDYRRKKFCVTFRPLC